MPTCPAGHDSTADDYCDVCGLPIPEAPAGPPTGGSPAEPVPVDAPSGAGSAGGGSQATCPNCSASNPPDALFCEACGYDFTTGQAPRPVEPSALDLDVPATPAGTGEGAAAGATRPEPVPADPVPVDPGPVAPILTAPWVAEVWIDPDWYAEQDSADPLPSAGVPVVVPLERTSVLVGRTSRSRNIHPDIDLTTDTGISRRHCQLTTDGTRWWVEDLGSSNGTYVGSSIGPLPVTPVPPGEKREIAPDQRLYLGAWTRIVIRRAQPGETS